MATKKIEDKKLRGKMGRQEYMNREVLSHEPLPAHNPRLCAQLSLLAAPYHRCE